MRTPRWSGRRPLDQVVHALRPARAGHRQRGFAGAGEVVPSDQTVRTRSRTARRHGEVGGEQSNRAPPKRISSTRAMIGVSRFDVQVMGDAASQQCKPLLRASVTVGRFLHGQTRDTHSFRRVLRSYAQWFSNARGHPRRLHAHKQSRWRHAALIHGVTWFCTTPYRRQGPEQQHDAQSPRTPRQSLTWARSRILHCGAREQGPLRANGNDRGSSLTRWLVRSAYRIPRWPDSSHRRQLHAELVLAAPAPRT